MPNTKSLEKTLQKSIILNFVLGIAILALVITLLYTTIYSVHVTSTVPPSNNVNTNNTNSLKQSGTLAGINQQLSASQLSVINYAPLSYYESAGERLINGSLTDQIIIGNSPQYNAIIINGKPSVIYVGAISCIFCGENRWAMALALGAFGNFTHLYQGYSSLGDGDIPTLYWNVDNITTQSGVTYGNFYNSSVINFISAEYDSPITGGFQIKPISFFVQHSPNATYTTALAFMNGTNKFQGTPFTFWGTSLVAGADALVFGNTTPTQATATLPITTMTHAQILNQLSNFNSQFAWGEYAAADVYIAQICHSVQNNAPVCKIPSISKLEYLLGF